MTVLSGRKVSDHMERISDAVEGAMIEAGYSVDALAAAAGWTPLRVHNRLDLESPWSIDELDAVAGVLGVPSRMLMASED